MQVCGAVQIVCVLRGRVCVCVCVRACVRAHASVSSVGYYVCVSLWCHPDMLVGEGDVCGVCVLAWGSTCACPSGAVQK